MIAKFVAVATVGVVLTAAFASRADITQTVNFSTNETFSGSGSATFIPAGYFSATFLPYTGSSNDLTGFEVDWTVTLSASATVESGQYGEFGGGAGGSFSLNNDGYGGIGGNLSSGSTVGPGGVIPLTTTTITNYTTFLTSKSGISYSPALLADVLSGAPVDLAWNSGFTMGYSSIQSGDFSETGSVTLIYNTVPEPGTLALAGLGASAVCCLRRRKA